MSTANVNTAVLANLQTSGVSSAARRACPRLSAAGLTYFRQVALTGLPLMAADLLGLALAVHSSTIAAGWIIGGQANGLTAMLLPMACAFFVINLLVGLYPGVGLNAVVEFRQSTLATVLLFSVFGAAIVFGSSPAETYGFVGAGVLSLATVPLLRSAARAAAGKCRWWGQPAIIFGDGPSAHAVYKAIQSRPGLGLRPVGLVKTTFILSRRGKEAVSQLSPQRAFSAANRHCVFWAIVAMPKRSGKNLMRLVDNVFLERYPHVWVIPEMKSLPSLWNRSGDCGGMPGLHVEDLLLLPVPRLVKRSMDLLIAIIAGLLLLPAVAMIALLIKAGGPGPVFYCQKRIGRGGRYFYAWKFRTMVVNADEILRQHLDRDPKLRDQWERDHKLRRDPRVTWIGGILRKTSLDELPQIWNVLRGDMSLVGPRPIVDQEIEKYAETFRCYTKVLPGITGLWQISGRNDTSYQERVEFDSYYVRNWSPWLDLYILVRTIKVVLLRQGAY